ncbi:MAG: ATP-binding cassette domain-containing protein [Gaiellaceae bacterium]
MKTQGEDAAIDVLDLAKTYPGDVRAVRGVSFRVRPGEVFGLLGPNGAGKSTTVGMLTTTIKPTEGTAKLVGYDVSTEPRRARAVSSVVFQEAVVDRALSGRRHLELHAQLWRVDGREAKSCIEELARALDLTELIDRSVGSYSGGQRRRLEIARALVSSPRVLFLDEPTVGLDPRIRAELLDVIGGLRDRSATTILLTTHYLDEAERLCDRIAIMHRGEIVALDSPRALRAALGHEIIELRALDAVDTTLSTLRSEGIAGGDAFRVGQTLYVPLHDHSAADAVALVGRTGIRASGISTREPTLDDVYLRLTGGQLAEAA